MKNNLGVYFALITQINENKYKNTNTYMSRIMTSWKVKSPGAAALFLSFLEISFKYTQKKTAAVDATSCEFRPRPRRPRTNHLYNSNADFPLI